MKKYTFMIALALSGLVAMPPAPVIAATSKAQQAQIKKLYAQLKKLPNDASPTSKVNSLVQKLSKLDPKKASTYYKVGLAKLAHTESNDRSADTLAKSVAKIVQKSNLTSSQVKKITSQVNKEAAKFEAEYVAVPGANGTTTVAALTGDITLNVGGKTISIDIGTGAVIDSTGNVVQRGSIAELAKTNPQLKEALKIAVQAYADQVANGEVDPAVGSVTLAGLVQVASEADPAGAAGYVRTAVEGVLQNPDLKSESGLAISTIVNAVASGNSGANLQTIINAASEAGQAEGVTFSQTTYESNLQAVNEQITEVGRTNANITIDLNAINPSPAR